MKKYRRLITAVLCFALVLSTIIVSHAETKNYLRWATFSDPRTLCPIMSEDNASSEVIGRLFTALLDFDTKTNLITDMAAAMPTISSDNKTITFKLRQGLKWDDGVEITAEDFKFSYDLIRDPAVNSPRYGDFMNIDTIETPDKYTIVFKLKAVDSALLMNFAYPYVVPKHIWEKADKTKLKEFSAANAPIGCGPYKFKEWKRAERVELVRNDLFYGDKAKTDGIIYDITPSNTTALVKVETQEDNFVSVPESDVARMKTIPSLYVKTVIGTTFDYLVYNIKTPYFSDKRVRQAISYTVNRDQIIKGIYKGIGQAASGSYVPALWCYNPNVKKYNYNLTLAKQLMDQAGWKVGSDGYRYKDGKRFEVTMLTNQGNKMREKAVVLLQSQLKPLGIKVSPRILDWNTMWSSYIDIGKFDCYYSGFITGIDGDQTVMFNSDKNIGSFNRGGYANKRVDELYDLARKTFDRNQQKKYYFEAQQLIAEDCPMTFIIYRSNSYAFNKKVQNTEVYDLLLYYNMHKWTVTQ